MAKFQIPSQLLPFSNLGISNLTDFKAFSPPFERLDFFFPRPPFGRPREREECFSGEGAPKNAQFFFLSNFLNLVILAKNRCDSKAIQKNPELSKIIQCYPKLSRAIVNYPWLTRAILGYPRLSHPNRGTSGSPADPRRVSLFALPTR